MVLSQYVDVRHTTRIEEINLPTSDYTTKLQSSRQYGTDTKTEI